MKTLFINAAFRDGSRTMRLAEKYLESVEGPVTTLDLGTLKIEPLMRDSLKVYNESVEAHSFEDPMFAIGKQFVEADEIVIAAPYWNLSIPAALHTYLELVCSQGVSFDITPDGKYVSLCKARKLTYITTSGGSIQQEDHAFGYVKALAEYFWKIEDIRYFKAEGMDVYGNDAEDILQHVMKEMV